MINIIMLALFVEAIVSAVKPLWKDGGKGLSVTEIVSIVIGVVLAVAMRIDLFSALVEIDIALESPSWVYYLFYVMSGIAIGRGPSFVYDLWKGFKKWHDMPAPEILTEVADAYDDVDLEITHWSVAQLREFCLLNDIPCEGCVEKDDYMNAIEHGGIVSDAPPDSEA